MRIVIVPTDFSSNADNAITCAFEYFKYEESKFIIVHAFADEVYANESLLDTSEIHIFRDQKQAEYDGKLSLLKLEYINISPNPKHEIVILASFTTLKDAVNKLVANENADLVFMGTQGATADPYRSYGSNTLNLIKNVNCPIMGIPMNYTYNRPANILFPSDLQLSYLGRELKLISCLAQSFRSVLHLLHISENEELSQRQLEVKDYWEYRFRESEKKYTHLKNNKVIENINAFIKEYHIDMIVLINSSQNPKAEVSNSQIIEEIGMNTRIPFLILQNLPR